MRPSHLPAAAVLVAASLTPAGAADLATIDRAVPDEPHYSTPHPTYCLLVFGPEAKTRVWLVRDGDGVYIHASPDGKALAQWRRCGLSARASFDFGDVWEDGGQVRYTGLTYAPKAPVEKLWVGVGGKRQEAGKDRRGQLAFGASPAEAPVVYFGGPLTLDLFFAQHPLTGDGCEDISAVVGTPGVGPGTFALFETDSYPPGAWPTAVIAFPSRDGGPPVVAKARLAEE